MACVSPRSEKLQRGLRPLNVPVAGDFCLAFGAGAGGGEVVVVNLEATAFDQQLVAVGATGVFPFADLAGEVAGVDVF